MPKGKHLGAELGVGAGADEHEIGDEAHELVGEAEKHGDGSCPITPAIRAGEGARALPPPRPEGAIRTDAQGVTAHGPLSQTIEHLRL